MSTCIASDRFGSPGRDTRPRPLVTYAPGAVECCRVSRSGVAGGGGLAETRTLGGFRLAMQTLYGWATGSLARASWGRSRGWGAGSPGYSATDDGSAWAGYERARGRAAADATGCREGDLPGAEVGNATGLHSQVVGEIVALAVLPQALSRVAALVGVGAYAASSPCQGECGKKWQRVLNPGHDTTCGICEEVRPQVAVAWRGPPLREA